MIPMRINFSTRRFSCVVSLSIFKSRIQTTSKNYQRYYTTKRLRRDLLSNTPNCYARAGEFRGYIFTVSFRPLCCVAVSIFSNK